MTDLRTDFNEKEFQKLAADIVKSYDLRGLVIILQDDYNNNRIAQSGLDYEEVKSALCHGIFVNEEIGE